MRALISVALLALLLLIGACGQKGPLYMPESEQPETEADSQES